MLAGLLDRATKPAPADDFVVTRVQESRDVEKGSKTTKPSDIAYLELGRDSVRSVAGVSLAQPRAGPCRGDSGGPLLKASSNTIIGVHSGTPKGCRGVSSEPQEVSVVRATRHPNVRLAVDVAVNPPPGVTRKVAVTITAPAKGGKVAHKAGSKTFTLARPLERQVSYDITSALASRPEAGDQVRVTVTLDGVFAREQTVTIAKPSEGTSPSG